jgi:hypothetical protein
VLRRYLPILLSVFGAIAAAAQQPAQPQVKVNMLNVCSPSAEEKEAIVSALSRVPKQPLFSPDFEIDRGRTSLQERPGFLQPGESTQDSSESTTATWVRIRREFSFQAMFSTVQYSFSHDAKNMMETLVFRVRDPKDLMQVSIEDSASSVTSPATMLTTNTPVSRIKLERFGKSSVVLALCPATEGHAAPDQSAYAPLFQNASDIVANYRSLLRATHIVPDELARVDLFSPSKPAPKPAARKSAPKNK